MGLCALPLDARRQTLRAGESSAGNMVCDAVRFATRADAVLLRAGSFSGDRVLPAGPLRLKNLGASAAARQWLAPSCRQCTHVCRHVSTERERWRLPAVDGPQCPVISRPVPRPPLPPQWVSSPATRGWWCWRRPASSCCTPWRTGWPATHVSATGSPRCPASASPSRLAVRLGPGWWRHRSKWGESRCTWTRAWTREGAEGACDTQYRLLAHSHTHTHTHSTYRLATEASSARGEEAFAALADCREVVGPGDATPLPVLLRNHFAMLAALAGKDGADTSFQRAAQDFEATPEVRLPPSPARLAVPATAPSDPTAPCTVQGAGRGMCRAPEGGWPHYGPGRRCVATVPALSLAVTARAASEGWQWPVAYVGREAIPRIACTPASPVEARRYGSWRPVGPAHVEGARGLGGARALGANRGRTVHRCEAPSGLPPHPIAVRRRQLNRASPVHRPDWAGCARRWPVPARRAVAAS